MKLTAETTLVELEAVDRQERAEALDDARVDGGWGALPTTRAPVGRILAIEGTRYVVASTYCCVAGVYSGDAWEIGTPPDGELVRVSFHE